MNQEQLQELNKFKESWGTLEQVKNMTLEQYTNTTSDSFMYMIEWGTKSLGGISGSYAIKAGIYAKLSDQKKEIAKQYTQDSKYLWYKSLGDNPYEAFQNVHRKIIDIIEAVKDNHLEDIENISPLWRGYKYKIAFLYQQIFGKELKILPIFNWNDLSKFLGNDDTSKSMLDLYTIAIKKYDIKTVDNAFTLMNQIYKNYKISYLQDLLIGSHSDSASQDFDNQEKLIEHIKSLSDSTKKDLFMALNLNDKTAIFMNLDLDAQMEIFNNLDSDKKLDIFNKSKNSDKLKLFEELDPENQMNIIESLEKRFTKKMSLSCKLGSFILLFLGLYFLFYKYLNLELPFTLNDTIWFWILWIPLCILVFNLDNILIIACSQLRKFAKNKK